MGTAVAIVVATVAALGLLAALTVWYASGIYRQWHIACRCAVCGHREHSRSRYYWPVCPGCGSTTSDTVEEVGRMTLTGWEARK